jgi:hypothetical protein
MSKTLIAATVVGTYAEAFSAMDEKNYKMSAPLTLFTACFVGTIRVPFALLAVQILPSKINWIVPLTLYYAAFHQLHRFKSDK